MVTALRIEASAGQHEATLHIEVDPVGTGAARVRIKAGSGPALDMRLAMPTQDEAELLIPMLAQDRADPVYMRALKGAAELIQSGGR